MSFSLKNAPTNSRTLRIISSTHSLTSPLFTLMIFYFTQSLLMNITSICVHSLILLGEIVLLLLLRKLNYFKLKFDYLIMIFLKTGFDLLIVLLNFLIIFHTTSLMNPSCKSFLLLLIMSLSLTNI